MPRKVTLLAALVVGVLSQGAFAQAPASTTPPAAPPVASPTPVTITPSSPLRPVESIPDTWHLHPAEVPAVHPLWRPLDAPPRLETPGPVSSLETRTTLYVSVKLSENGRAVEAVAVEPPLRAFTTPIPALVPRWRFEPAKKAGKPVATWATWAVELAVELSKGFFSTFDLKPVGKDEPLPKVVSEVAGDPWLAKYPKSVTPPEPGVVSVEELDAPPELDSNKWSFDPARLRARVTALLEISETGAVSRIVPTGEFDEALLIVWLRKIAAGWRLSPATAGGKPVASWVSLDAALDYTIASAKKKGERSIPKNLRGPRAD